MENGENVNHGKIFLQVKVARPKHL